jgi:hypothetical protein
MLNAADLDRFTARISPEPNSGCWLFDGAATPKGYGTFTPRGERAPQYAHRLAFEALGGQPIPEGAHVLHRCDVRCCVNPDHLFLGDQAANMRDMAAKGRNVLTNRPLENSLRTHCKHGHRLSGSNLWIRADGSRICRTCRRRIHRNWRKKNGK